MNTQLVFIHGIGKSTSKRVPYEQLATPLVAAIPSANPHFVRWHDLGFDRSRVLLDDQDEKATFRSIVANHSSRYLFERLSLLLQLRQRDLVKGHPSWTVQTKVHRAELKFVDLVLDYLGDVEVYLRDDDQRSEIQERIEAAIKEAAELGPVTIVCHSLGTVVSYDVIHERLPMGTVKNLVTLGSPLEHLLYLAQGSGLVGYDLTLDPGLNWLNVFDVKDLIASAIASGDFSSRGDDWWVRMVFSIREDGLRAEPAGESVSFERFWRNRDKTGMRINVGINRDSSGIEAHSNYWKHSKNLSAVATLIAGLVVHSAP